MNEVQSLVQSLTTVCSSFLGAEYSEMKFKRKIEDNSFMGSTKKYGVVSGDISDMSGATRFVTVTQNFDINLTNSYITTANGDSPKDNAIVELQDKGLELYREILNTKANNPAIVMNINSLSSNIEELEEDKVIVNKLSFDITYRKGL